MFNLCMDSLKEKKLTDYILKYKGEFSFEEINAQLIQYGFTTSEVREIYEKLTLKKNKVNFSKKQVKMISGILILIAVSFLVWFFFPSGNADSQMSDEDVYISELEITGENNLASITINNFGEDLLVDVEMSYQGVDCQLSENLVDFGINNFEYNSSECVFISGVEAEILLKSSESVYTLMVTP